MKAIAKCLVNVSIYDVLPQVQPDLEDLIHHAIANTLNQLPVYQELQNSPEMNHLPAWLTENIAKSLSHLAYNNLINTTEDPVAAEISTRLSSNFGNALEKELPKKTQYSRNSNPTRRFSRRN